MSEYGCKNCNKIIPIKESVGRLKRYCNVFCKREWESRYKHENKKYTKVCSFCGRKYKTNSERQKYCPDCGDKKVWSQERAVKQALLVQEFGVKKCSRCGVEKPVSKFSISKSHYDGYNGHCKECQSEIWAKRKALGKIKRNPESICKSHEHTRMQRAADPKYKSYRREYDFMRRHTDPAFRLKYLIKSNIWTSIRRHKGSREHGRHWESLVGFTLDELQTHLEAQFHNGMSWDNVGKWHIDHIIPASFFNFNTPDDLEFKMCWALENLQPMWGADNIRKNAKLP